MEKIVDISPSGVWKGDLIRCKDCKNWLNGHICVHWSGYYGTIETTADDFCSFAERSEK